MPWVGLRAAIFDLCWCGWVMGIQLSNVYQYTSCRSFKKEFDHSQRHLIFICIKMPDIIPDYLHLMLTYMKQKYLHNCEIVCLDHVYYTNSFLHFTCAHDPLLLKLFNCDCGWVNNYVHCMQRRDVLNQFMCRLETLHECLYPGDNWKP